MASSVQPHGLWPTRLLCPWEFSRQESWSGLLFPSPGHLPHPGIEPRSPALQADALPSEPPRKPEERNTSKGGKSLTSQDLAKQTYSSTSSSLSSKKQPMNLTDSSKLIQVSAVTLDMIKVRNGCFFSDCDIQRQKDIHTRQQLHHRGMTAELVNGKSTRQRQNLGKHDSTQKHIRMEFGFWKVETQCNKQICPGCVLADLFVLQRVLPNV